MESTKLTESAMLATLKVGRELLERFTVVESQSSRGDAADARIKVELRNEPDQFAFVVEAKSDSTPRVLSSAISQVRKLAGSELFPLVLMPYLSAESIKHLEAAQVSGIDLCGNGVIVIPRRLYVVCTGQPNLYPDSRPLSNPFRGRSATVARMLLSQPKWNSLTELRAAIKTAGAELSLSQTSKAISALQEDLLVSNERGRIELQEPLRLLDRLGANWKSTAKRRQSLRLAPGTQPGKVLSSSVQLEWAVTGESSASRYTVFNQGGPRQIAVTYLDLAAGLLPGKPEPIRSFADVELIETDDPGFYLSNEVDQDGMRWASRLQSWLELQAGDGRQREAAQDLRRQILQETQPK